LKNKIKAIGMGIFLSAVLLNVANSEITLRKDRMAKLEVQQEIDNDNALRIKDSIWNAEMDARYGTDNNSFLELANTLGFRESSDNYDTVGGANNAYIGRYQMGPMAFKDVYSDDVYTNGNKDYTKADSLYRTYRNDPTLWTKAEQDKAFKLWVTKLKLYMNDELDTYVGETVHGVKITTNGLIAAAHLIGHASVKNWLEHGGDIADAFGTTPVEYLLMFT
jgi:hypothetical protein